MTLGDFTNMIFTDSGDLAVYCFESEEARDCYRSDPKEGGLEFAFCSPFKCSVFLNEKYANAEVIQMYPISDRAVDVVLWLGQPLKGATE